VEEEEKQQSTSRISSIYALGKTRKILEVNLEQMKKGP
jgi:hypothetical protein